MKKTRWLSILVCFVMVIALVPCGAFADTPEGGVEINETNFPNAIFRDYISEHFDTDSNGSLSESEIAQSKEIYLSFDEASTIKGVEFLTALEKLWAPVGLTELDVSKNTALTHIHLDHGTLAELDLSNNPDLVELWCHSCHLGKLDLSHNTKLKELRCSFNDLTTLDLSNNTALTSLDCSDCQLKTLKVPKNGVLQNLHCGYNQLTELDLSGMTVLNNVQCMSNQIATLNLSGCTSLANLDCNSNQLKTLDLPASNLLFYLGCFENQLTSLDLSGCPNLAELWCHTNQLTSLDLTKNTRLEQLRCDENKIELLDISSCPRIERAYFNGTAEERYSTWDYVDATETDPFGRARYRLWVDKKTDVISSRIDRLAGKDRFLTAIETADWLKDFQSLSVFPNIVIASGTDFPDALAGAYLATVKDAPVLLTNAGFAPKLAQYVKANLASNGTVYILGGTGAVPEIMETELQKLGITKVKRLAGSDRYQTNLMILKEAGVTGQDLLVCSGKGYADSLSASALGRPILLVGSGLTEEQADYLNNVKSDLKGNIYVLGGTGVVSDDVLNNMKTYATGETQRVAGADRFKTSVAVAEKFMPKNVPTAVLAYAMNYPDGLAGGPVAFVTGSPLLLITDSFYSEADAYAKSAGINDLILMGGKTLIPHYVAREVLVS